MIDEFDWLEPLRKDTERIREYNKKLREETNKIREDTNKIREDIKKIREETNKIREDTNKIREDTNKIRDGNRTGVIFNSLTRIGKTLFLLVILHEKKLNEIRENKSIAELKILLHAVNCHQDDMSAIIEWLVATDKPAQ